jgi:hypothetical protein
MECLSHPDRELVAQRNGAGVSIDPMSFPTWKSACCYRPSW